MSTALLFFTIPQYGDALASHVYLEVKNYLI